VTFIQTSVFVDKNVGLAKTVNVSGIALGGADAFNYLLLNDTATTSAHIAAKPVTVTVTAHDKTYDGGVGATVKDYAFDGLVGSETLKGSSAQATFDTKNVGADKTVTISGIALADGANGGLAANYTLVSMTATDKADITAKSLTAAYTGMNKVYDGTTAATANGASGDIIAGDTVIFLQTAHFTDKNAGTGKTVNVADIALGGADAGNYALQNTTATATADIAAAPLTVKANDRTKTYGETVLFEGKEFTSVGLVGGETIGYVTLASLGAAAGAGVGQSPYAITASDAQGGTFLPGNYAIAYQEGTLTVNKASLTNYGQGRRQKLQRDPLQRRQRGGL